MRFWTAFIIYIATCSNFQLVQHWAANSYRVLLSQNLNNLKNIFSTLVLLINLVYIYVM